MVKEYIRADAIAYARKHALTHNPNYFYFGGIGGDCTNFISQCLMAGGGVMNFNMYTGWYYNNINDRAPSWTGVNFFQDYLLRENGIGPFAKEVEVFDLQVGDVIQLRQGEIFNHSLIITEVLPNDFLVCAHSNDVLDKRFSTYRYIEKKCFHVEGVKTK